MAVHVATASGLVPDVCRRFELTTYTQHITRCTTCQRKIDKDRAKWKNVVRN